MKKPRLANLVNSVISATACPAVLISKLRFQRSNDPSPVAAVNEKLEEYRMKVADTNIDPRSLLSTDYFNSFNSVVMILDMLPDAPELLDEVEQWQFIDYIEHFKTSGLDFADLAIEVYPFAPPQWRDAFEHKVNGIREVIEDVAKTLRLRLDAEERDAFAHIARTTAAKLRTMMEEGNAIVHGNSTSSQADIDKLF